LPTDSRPGKHHPRPAPSGERFSVAERRNSAKHVMRFMDKPAAISFAKNRAKMKQKPIENSFNRA